VRTNHNTMFMHCDLCLARRRIPACVVRDIRNGIVVLERYVSRFVARPSPAVEARKSFSLPVMFAFRALCETRG
jgi:hypothetical protein